MKHLFSQEERNGIENKFGDDILFEVIRMPCLSLMNESRTFALHPSELYYHVFYTIDEIKSNSLTQAKKDCHKVLWDDLLSHFRDQVGDECFTEAQQAAGMVMYVVALVFAWSGNPIYTSIIGVLINRVKEHVPDFSIILYQKFTDSFSTIDTKELRQLIERYLESNREISTEIEELRDSIPNKNFNQQYEENSMNVYIASNKLSSVIVVLEAMYKAGWFIDANGKQLTNRNKTLSHILETAFGKKDANITQLLNSVKNRNKGKDKNSIFDELLNQE